MAEKLKVNVMVRDEQGLARVLLAGEEVPAGLRDQIDDDRFEQAADTDTGEEVAVSGQDAAPAPSGKRSAK